MLISSASKRHTKTWRHQKHLVYTLSCASRYFRWTLCTLRSPQCKHPAAPFTWHSPLRDNKGSLYIGDDTEDLTSFQSAHWRRGYNPDLAFISSRYYLSIDKSVGNHFPRAQHRPIISDIKPVIRLQAIQHKPRFNFRKANWGGFCLALK